MKICYQTDQDVIKTAMNRFSLIFMSTYTFYEFIKMEFNKTEFTASSSNSSSVITQIFYCYIGSLKKVDLTRTILSQKYNYTKLTSNYLKET